MQGEHEGGERNVAPPRPHRSPQQEPQDEESWCHNKT